MSAAVKEDRSIKYKEVDFQAIKLHISDIYIYL